jgi:hypothetical protein
MRLGIGGGAFGFRGGISTRGVGVGVGPFSAGTSWRGRRSRKSGGGGFLVFLIALVVAPFMSLCSHPSHPVGAGHETSATTQAPKAAPPPPPGVCPTTPNIEGAEDGSPGKRIITLPDLVGLNAQVAENHLRNLDLKDLMSSANPNYKIVLQALNWTVVDMYPPAGCTVSPYDRIDLSVTKP